MQINNINDLINVIDKSKFSKNQIIEIVEKTINVFIHSTEVNKNLTDEIVKYWSKYNKLPLNERPLFLD
jgi:phosphoenolpyruvate synthase/pyruvate phosphate dikinase